METTLKTVINVMRSQSWQRAKGELNAYLNTFISNDEEYEMFLKADKAIEELIEFVENNDLN